MKSKKKATPLRCEPENLVEEHTTKVYVHKEDKVNNMNDKSYDFFSIHLHLKPSHPCEDGNTSLSYEDCKMK